MTNKEYTLQIKDNLKKVVTLYDFEFQDYYTFFNLGKDSVVTCKAKELKGWVIGIWFDNDEETFSIFAEHNKHIDKFKPSHATFSMEKVRLSALGDDWEIDIYNVEEMFLRIKNHRIASRVSSSEGLDCSYESNFQLIGKYIKLLFPPKEKVLDVILGRRYKSGEYWVYDGLNRWQRAKFRKVTNKDKKTKE